MHLNPIAAATETPPTQLEQSSNQGDVGNAPISIVDLLTTLNALNTPKTEGNSGYKRSPPTPFTGNRNKVELFMGEFKCYWKLNKNKAEMKEPYSQVLMALTYFKGERVQDWIDAQSELLEIRAAKFGGDHDYIWNEFRTSFESAFISTTRSQDTYTKLKNLKMKENNLDKYIAMYSNLVTQTGWDIKGEAAVESFRNGLYDGLYRAILGRYDLLTTLNEWHMVARIEHRKWALKLASGLLGGKKKWTLFPEKGKKTREYNPDTMDVDYMKLAPLSKQERERLIKEGRCFCCQEKGHQSRNCPKREAKIHKAKVIKKEESNEDSGEESNATSLLSTSTKVAKVATISMNNDNLYQILKNSLKENRAKVMERILEDEEEDF